MWHSGSVPVAEQSFVKFAWSRPAALQLAHEISLLAGASERRHRGHRRPP